LHGAEKKCVAAYPWKLIYDTVTEDEMLFNLEHDPGEKHNLLDQDTQARGLLEEAMFKTLFGMSNTWYIELVGGSQSHTFDLEIAAQQRPMAGSIQIPRWLDKEGHITSADELPLGDESSKVIKLEGLELQGTLTLGFQVSPKRVPMTFDLRIDGEPAITKTFLGETLANPEEMPFSARAGRREISSGFPPTRPEPPYFLLWHQDSAFQGEKPVSLDEEIKKELRALGYIQ
jgi:hypothetical protein